MVELLQASVLSDDETTIMNRLFYGMGQLRSKDRRLDAYYEGSQRVDQLGIAIPPELRRFETVVNWCRVGVDEVERRQDVKAIYLPDETAASDALREGWEANNLDSEVPMHLKECLIFGRGFMTVGTNEDDDEHPLITVESPRQMSAVVEQRRRRMLGALRDYSDWDGTRRRTLYLPDSTIWMVQESGRWSIEDRDDHGLGRVPVVLFLNRRRLGEWNGTSEMVDIIPLVDAAVRTLTNLQIAGETHSVPQKAVVGVAMKDFVDARTGKQLTTWESYFTSLMATANKDAKIFQLSGSDLKNFHDTINHYAHLVASVTGLPLRYLGQQSVNPAAEGAIRAEEARFVKNVERKEVASGDALGWVMALYERIRTGEWIDGNQIKVEWHDPGTPTFAQKADAIQKLNGGTPTLSRQGSWDEMGWDEARKTREKAYFEEEARDPQLDELAGLNPVDDYAKRVTAVGTDIRAGFDPEEARAAAGLPPIEHSGLAPVTVQGKEKAMGTANGLPNAPRSG